MPKEKVTIQKARHFLRHARTLLAPTAARRLAPTRSSRPESNKSSPAQSIRILSIAGNGLKILQRAGISVTTGVLEEECTRLNEAFNHWIIHRTPLVIVKSAMSLDGRIATRSGESKWITNEQSRAQGMKLRAGCDAILVGINTVLRDNPSLTVRAEYASKRAAPLRRIVLDPSGRIQRDAKLLTDEFKAATTVVVSQSAPKRKIEIFRKHVNVIVAPLRRGKIDLRWLLKKLGQENVTQLLVEGGGETNAHFLLNGFAHRVAFFYAPIVIGGREAPRAVGGDGILKLTGQDCFRGRRMA